MLPHQETEAKANRPRANVQLRAWWCFAWLLCAGCADTKAKGLSSTTRQTTIVLSIVGTNDLHGHVEKLPWFGGYVHNLRKARARDGGVLLLDAGDMFQGTLVSNLREGEVVVEAYNQLGYAAAAIGNHEFDFGPEGPAAWAESASDDPRGALKARARQAKFPFLTANVVKEGGQALDWPNVHPTARVVVGEMQVGLIGVTTEDTPAATLARNFAGLSLVPLADTIAAHARRLRREGVDVVVVVAHAGASCRSFAVPSDTGSCSRDAEIFDVARALPRGLVNAIVAGHTHAGVAHEVAGIPIIEAHSYGRAFGRVDLTVDRKSHKVVGHELHVPQDICGKGSKGSCSDRVYEGAPVRVDRAVQAIVQPALDRVQALGDRRLRAKALARIPRGYRTESPLGNLVTDLMRAARPHADVAVTNGGGLRQDLPAGEVTYGQLYEALPFDNTFASAEITGAQMAELIRRNLQTSKGFLSVSGLRAEARCERSHLTVTLYRLDGRPIAENERLVLLTHDFLASGGDGLFGRVPFTIEALPPFRDELARVLEESRPSLDPYALYDEGHPRVAYPGVRPVRCGQAHSASTPSASKPAFR